MNGWRPYEKPAGSPPPVYGGYFCIGPGADEIMGKLNAHLEAIWPKDGDNKYFILRDEIKKAHEQEAEMIRRFQEDV